MIINPRNITHTNHPHASTYLCPQKLTLLPLTRPKYVMHKIQNRNFVQPMKSHSIYIIDPIFFFWGERGGVGGKDFLHSFCFECVPIKFTMDAHPIPGFPKF
jgi:hypothetical protein